MGKSIAQVATDLGVTPQYVCAQEARSSGGAKGYTLAFYSLYRAEIEQLGYSLEDLLRGRRIRSVA